MICDGKNFLIKNVTKRMFMHPIHRRGNSK